MPKMIEIEVIDLARELTPGPNKEVHVTTDGILEGLQEINQTKEMQDFYDSVIPRVKNKTS